MTRADVVEVLREFPLPRAPSVVASAAKQSISPRDGPPTSSQNWSCSKCFKDPRWGRTRRGPIGGGGAVASCTAMQRTNRRTVPVIWRHPDGASGSRGQVRGLELHGRRLVAMIHVVPCRELVCP